MGIPWSGSTQSNGSPGSSYSYSLETWGRTATKVHVRLWCNLRMHGYNSYFTFRIAHETKVYSRVDGAQRETYQWAWIKDSYPDSGEGTWWGNGYGNGGWGDQSFWRGPWVVFDQDVPIGLDDDTLNIVPVVVRPPCYYHVDNPAHGYWTPSLDKNNWQGHTGFWRAFSGTEYGHWPESWFYHIDHGCEEDMAFGNNRWKEPLGGGTNIGKYPRPDNVANLKMNPMRIDVANQDTQNVTLTWNRSNRAAGYEVLLCKGSRQEWKGANTSTMKMVNGNVSSTSFSFNPKQHIFGGTNWRSKEIFDGETYYIAVRAHDSSYVPSRDWTWVGPLTYYEVPSEAPTNVYVIGRNGKINECLFKGETLIIGYSGEKNGSYPIARYELVRLEDGAKVTWNVGEKGNLKDVKGALRQGVQKFLPSWPRPNVDLNFELRVYNTKNRPVYLKGTKSWFRFKVHYYGGILYVFGKYAGGEGYVNDEQYAKVGGGNAWRMGLCRVWGKRYYYGSEQSYNALSDSPTWHEAELVHVWTGRKRETL